MTLNFNNFLLERMGYSFENEKITDYIIKYFQKSDDMKEIEEILIPFENDINLKKVILEFIPYYSKSHGKWASFIPEKSNYNEKGSEIYIIIDPDEITDGNLNHELFHSFEWIKNKGRHLINNEEMSIIGLYNYFREIKNEKILEIIHIFYKLSLPELKAQYNETIYELLNYINKDIKILIKNSDFFKEYNEIKDYNIRELILKLPKKDINEFMSVYDLMKGLKEYEEGTVEIRSHTQDEINNFINILSNIYNYNIKKYKKYIDRLYSFF